LFLVCACSLLLSCLLARTKDGKEKWKWNSNVRQDANVQYNMDLKGCGVHSCASGYSLVVASYWHNIEAYNFIKGWQCLHQLSSLPQDYSVWWNSWEISTGRETLINNHWNNYTLFKLLKDVHYIHQLQTVLICLKAQCYVIHF
jgi:hypothetical protein